MWGEAHNEPALAPWRLPRTDFVIWISLAKPAGNVRWGNGPVRRSSDYLHGQVSRKPTFEEVVRDACQRRVHKHHAV